VHDVHTLLAHPADGRNELLTALSGAGLRVTAVETATEALASLSQEAFDCLVSVYELPGDDGLALFDAVRAVEEGTPFVLYADVDDATANEAFSAGVDRFVSRSREDSVTRLVEEITDLTAPVASLPRKQDISGSEPDAVDVMRAVDEAPTGISICEPSLPDYPLVYVNDAWEDMTGYSREEVLGRNPRILQGPETDPEKRRALAAAIESETPITVELRNYRRDGTPFWNEVTVAPIYDEEGELELYVGFQNDVTGRKNAEQLADERASKLTEEKQTLRRILGRVNGLLAEINRVLVEENQRRFVLQRICDEIAREDGYAASWFGSLTPPEDAIELEAVAGFPTGVETTIDVEATPVAVTEAIADGELRICTAESGPTTPLGPVAVGARRLAVVPVSYGPKDYGVLGVYGEGIEALDRREQQLFGSIGTMLANRLNAIETTKILTVDSVTEVTVEIGDPSFPLSTVAETLGTEVEYVGMTRDTDARLYELFLTASPCETLGRLGSLSFVENVREISRTNGAYSFALSVETGSPFADLADHGASVTAASAEEGRATVVFELPPEQDVRAALEVLEELYDRVEMRSRREREAREQTIHEFASDVDDRLTDRQRAALQAAHMNGYFEWPRPSDGAEIAETMGITRQTFHQHLRAAERKLIDAYVELSSDPPADRETPTQRP